MTSIASPVSSFAELIGSLRTRKTPDTFWPIGQYRSRFAIQRALELVREASDARGSERFEFPFTPSVLLNLHYAFVIGARTEARGDATDATLADRLLRDLLASRVDPSFALRRQNRLRAVDEMLLREFEGHEPVAHSSASHLSGVVLGVAEAAAFNCYRAVTELHGPYVTQVGFAMVRSVDLGLLSGLLGEAHLPADEVVHIVSFQELAPESPPFDFFGHPLFDQSPDATVVGVEDLAELVLRLETLLEQRSRAVIEMSDGERAAEFARILTYCGARGLGLAHEESRELSHRLDHQYPLSTPWRWPRPVLVAAMELSKELQGEDRVPWN
jgi:hypothetical protein